MIVWLNGTFGAGKTTTAGELVQVLPQARLFDAEQVGYMLGHVPDLPDLGNFQHWPPWRHLVVETASQLLDYVGGTLVVTQTVLVEQYWEEIRSGLERAGIPVHHFVLHSDPETMERRIKSDAEHAARHRDWRLAHLADYREAVPWLRRSAQFVDTGRIDAREAARVVAASVGE